VRKTIWRKVEFEHEFEKFTASVDISYTHDIIEGIFQKITEGVRVGWVKDKSGKIAVITPEMESSLDEVITNMDLP